MDERYPRLELPTVDVLRARGSEKWSYFPGTIGAFVAEMDFGLDAAIKEVMHRAIDAGLTGYAPRAAIRSMSEACAQWQHDSYGWQIEPHQVVPVADVIVALEMAVEQFSTPGTPIIVPTPAYMPFLSVTKNLRRDVIEVPMSVTDGRYEMDLQALDDAFAAGGDLLILCNPHNPTGRVFSHAELAAVGQVVSRNGGRVFSDEIHAPLIYPGAAHVPYASISAETAGHSLTVTSASKAWNIPAGKCAQLIVTNDEVSAIWDRYGGMASHRASGLGVLATTAAYTDGRPWLAEATSYLDGNRAALAGLLAERIPEIGYLPPEGTYIGWLNCHNLGLDAGETGSPEAAAEFFRREAGVAMTDGAACGQAGGGYARFVFATPRPIIEQAVDQMAVAMRRHHGTSRGPRRQVPLLTHAGSEPAADQWTWRHQQQRRRGRSAPSASRRP